MVFTAEVDLFVAYSEFFFPKCFDTVGWTTGRTSGLLNLRVGLLVVVTFGLEVCRSYRSRCWLSVPPLSSLAPLKSKMGILLVPGTACGAAVSDGNGVVIIYS